jgi:carboxymethylenebutenolidase
MSESENPGAGSGLTAAQEYLRQLWEEHVRHEFTTHNTEETLATMVKDAYVNHIPVLTGGVGKDQLREFYSKRFIPQMPPDTEMIPVSRTIGSNQLVDEMVFKFTHTIRMDWMLPGVAPTGRRVEVPLVAIVHFRGGSWRTSTYTGTKRPCSSNSGCSRPPRCRSRVLKARVRSWIRASRRTL